MGVDRRRGRDRPDRAVSLFRVEGALPADDHATRTGRLASNDSRPRPRVGPTRSRPCAPPSRSRWMPRPRDALQRRILQNHMDLLATPRQSEKEEAERLRSRELVAEIEDNWSGLIAEGIEAGAFADRDPRMHGPTGPGVGHQRLALVPTRAGDLTLEQITETVADAAVRIVRNVDDPLSAFAAVALRAARRTKQNSVRIWYVQPHRSRIPPPRLDPRSVHRVVARRARRGDLPAARPVALAAHRTPRFLRSRSPRVGTVCRF